MKNLLFSVLFLTICDFSLAQSVVPEHEIFRCMIVEIINGSTITCLTDQKEPVKVKLYGIDVPELDQPYGEEVKRHLSIFISKELSSTSMFRRTTRIKVTKKDKNEDAELSGILIYAPCEPDFFGRWTPPIDYNYKLIELGYAWYNRTDGDNPEYQQAEQDARKVKRGLWVDNNPIPPWEWRAKNKK